MNPYFLVFEGMVYALFAACLWNAARRGRFAVTELVWTVIYGFLLEWLTLKQLAAYHYGSFALMLDGAPLAVAVGWAVIIYASMRFSDTLTLPDTVRPLLDALLALNVDLSLDTIAIRLGMWFWTGVDRDAQWFGVPWANFWAWFLVVWSFSTCLRALRGWQSDPVRRWLAAPTAMLFSLLALVIANSLFYLLTDPTAQALASLFVLAASLWLVLEHRPRLRPSAQPGRIVWVVPLAFHGFALASGLAAGIFSQQPVLALVGILMLLLSLGLHGMAGRLTPPPK
jgi:hypothetical protein